VRSPDASARGGWALGIGGFAVALAAIALFVVQPRAPVETQTRPESAHARAMAEESVVIRAAPEREDAVATNRFAPVPLPTPAIPPRPIEEALDAGTPPAVAAPTEPEPPSGAAIQVAFRATPIVMFSTTWCPVCERARAFLDANGLSRDERDVDRDERARDELERLTGKGSIPTFVVDGVLLKPGFSETSLMRAVVASVEKRLNYRGIELRRR
jgi:glutaredoxin